MGQEISDIGFLRITVGQPSMDGRQWMGVNGWARVHNRIVHNRMAHNRIGNPTRF